MYVEYFLFNFGENNVSSANEFVPAKNMEVQLKNRVPEISQVEAPHPTQRH